MSATPGPVPAPAGADDDAVATVRAAFGRARGGTGAVRAAGLTAEGARPENR
jgi:hypothetical protein